jgi:site-specific recombinase XerC
MGPGAAPTWTDGAPSTCLEKMRSGVRYSVRLDARDEEEAERELAAFESRPLEVPCVASAIAFWLSVDAKTIQTVLDWQAAEGQAVEHRYATRLYLKQWAQELKGQDLNGLSVAECERVLGLWSTARKMRIVALKTFCTYHSKRGLLTNNPAAKLEIPKSLAAKHTAPRHYQREEVERAYRATATQVQRDVIQLACKTGLHLTEIERFSAGVGRLVKVEGQGAIAGVIWVLHKSGEQHPNSLDASAFAAAERIQARGRIPDRPKRHDYAVRVAARLSRELVREVRPVQYGALRHSFITWARSKGGRIVRPVDYGVTLDEIRDVVGHKSTKTTSGYDGTEIPPMIVVPIDLSHASDPKLVEAVRAPRTRSRRSSAGRRKRNRVDKGK